MTDGIYDKIPLFFPDYHAPDNTELEALREAVGGAAQWSREDVWSSLEQV